MINVRIQLMNGSPGYEQTASTIFQTQAENSRVIRRNIDIYDNGTKETQTFE
jgi:hypothetical protein